MDGWGSIQPPYAHTHSYHDLHKATMIVEMCKDGITVNLCAPTLFVNTRSNNACEHPRKRISELIGAAVALGAHPYTTRGRCMGSRSYCSIHKPNQVWDCSRPALLAARNCLGCSSSACRNCATCLVRCSCRRRCCRWRSRWRSRCGSRRGSR